MSPASVVLLLSLLLGLQPITTDLYLPTLPALSQDFAVAPALTQYTLTVLLLAFGVSQLFWGPLSDRFGRRPVLLAGLSIYSVAALASALAPSMVWLIAARAVQGAAMGATVMAARAIVRDLYQPQEAARAMSKGLSGLGVIACLSAPLGGWLSELWGWRWALSTLALFGALTLALVLTQFRETNARPNPQALAPRTLVTTWWFIVRQRAFIAYCALALSSYCGLFVFLASSSFVCLVALGLSKTAYGVVMFFSSLVYIVGTFMCRRMLLRWGVRRTVALASLLTIGSSALLLVLALLGIRNIWAVVLPFYGYMLGHGVHQPCGQSGAVAPFAKAAGAASALNGFLMMVAAFATGAWLGPRLGDSVLALAQGVFFWSLVIVLTAWTLVRWYGEPPAN